MSQPKSFMTLEQAEAQHDECEATLYEAKARDHTWQPWVQSYRARLLSLKELCRRKRAEERRREDVA